MQYKFKNKNDVKIFILFLLKHISRPLLYSELNDIVLQDELVSWFDCAECVNDLVKTGNVKTNLSAGGLTYEITPQGRMVSDSLESDIMGYIRTQGLKSAMRYLSFKEKGIRVAVTSSPRDDGRVDMMFTMKENGDLPMEIKLIADNDYQARKMSYNFQNQPEVVYRSVLSLLSGDANYLLQ